MEIRKSGGTGTGGMSMADDNRYYRSDDDYARGASAAGADPRAASASDPLAELARLIGQTDPFAELRRQATRTAQQNQYPAAAEHEDWRGADSHNDYQQLAAGDRGSDSPAPAYYSDHHLDGHASAGYETYSTEPVRDRASIAEAYHDEPQHQEAQYHEERYDASGYGGQNSGNRSAGQFESIHGARQQGRYASESLPEQHYASPAVQPDDAAHMAYDERTGALSAYPNSNLEAPSFYQGEQNFDDDGQDFYQDDEAPRRRKVWMTAAAVCALAVVGSASAFGYRAIFGKPSSPTQAPVITANASPIKVLPPAPAADAQAGKINYDRFGDKGQGEKVVVREEQPVDVNAAKPESPRAVQNALAGQNSSSSQTAPATTATILPVSPIATAPALASSASGEPKKVRTVTIKPDQPSGLDSLSAKSAAVQTPSSRLAAPPPGSAATQAAPAPMRTASAPSNVRPSAEPSVAGGFMVQVSSQKNEADAKASYKTLQAKFPSQLQNRSAIIRRADVTGKGTFYRAQVGPFSSSDQANEFCKTLQAAGGQCVVQRN
jgi:cell division septation protein DedD